MLQRRRQRVLTLLLVLGAPASFSAGFWWLACRNPAIRFLPERSPARWVAYPIPPDLLTPAVEQEAIFSRSFVLGSAPAEAALQVRAFGSFTVRVNQIPIELTTVAANWKQPSKSDISPQLRAGTNEISVVVANDQGPCALWLSLTGDGLSLVTDEQWQVSLAGAMEQPARPASAPPLGLAGNLTTGGERTIESVRARAPLLVLFAVLSAAVLAAAYYWGKCLRAQGRQSFLTVRLVAAGTAALWGLLFLNNLASFSFPLGFDAQGHLDYIRYIQAHRALPLANEGWEMNQPPLYYIISALALSACGVSLVGVLASGTAVAVLRLVTLAAGIAQVVLVFASLRLLFPRQPMKQGIGLLLAALLPAQLYLFHYVTNETLMAMLGTATLYLCLRLIRARNPSTAQYLAVGVCLGAALLTKLTALVLAAVVLVVLGGWLVWSRQRGLLLWLRTWGAMVGSCLAVSGWHYARVWAHFGNPLVGNYDPESGFRWWQTPGAVTSAFFLRFGRSLTEPFFSSCYGFPDGFYSTLWGDGLYGGAGTWSNRPPWNYDLMAAGYLVALVPTLLVLIGLARALIRLVRRPRAEWFLLLGLAFAMAAALVVEFLRVPNYGHSKAFYCLMATVPFCAWGSLGYEVLARRRRVVGALLAIALGTWALTAYASFWVQRQAPATQTRLGKRWLRLGDDAAAWKCFHKALGSDPRSVSARLAMTELLLGRADNIAAQQQVEQILAEDPENWEAHFLMGLALEQRHHNQAAVCHLRRVLELAPQHLQAGFHLGNLLAQQGQTEAAIQVYRQALSVAPADPALHAALGKALAKNGQWEEAIRQYRQALRLPAEPLHPVHDQPVMMSDEDIRNRLKLYQAGRPDRTSPPGIKPPGGEP